MKNKATIRQPNIIFILLDDLGWRDLTCYGSLVYETSNPNLLATCRHSIEAKLPQRNPDWTR